jgi:hypothetical protein
MAVGLIVFVAGAASAYDQYSVNKDATNCAACHGDYRASPYTSLTDGMEWPADLMDVHSSTMLSGDCSTCHGSGPRFPVALNTSAGGLGLDPISCVGCHGRAEDRGVNPDDCVGAQNPAPPGCVANPSLCPAPTANEVCGDGAGLRQHHYVANQIVSTPGGDVSTRVCAECHADSDPSAFTAVTEDIFPPYYSNNDAIHPNIPSDPCNPEADGFPEDYAGTTAGLDNDGDGLYDELDPTACPEPSATTLLASGLGLLLVLARRRNQL